jgi:hypothetical protein
MPRMNRHFLPGHVWHITHRCHRNNQYNLLILGRSKRRLFSSLFLVKAETRTLEELGFSKRQKQKRSNLELDNSRPNVHFLPLAWWRIANHVHVVFERSKNVRLG